MKRIKLLALLMVSFIFFSSIPCFAAVSYSPYWLGLNIPFSTDHSNWNLNIEGMYACLKDENVVVFSIKFNKGSIRFYSLFNPPYGDKLQITGNPGDVENSKGLVNIFAPLDKAKDFGTLTIGLVDGDSHNGYIFLTPSKINFSALPRGAFFNDANLENTIRELTGIKAGLIYPGDLTGIRVLNAGGKGIKELDGIKYLVNLEELHINNNNIKDISELTRLKKLKILDLGMNSLQNIDSLRDMSGLTRLDLSNNILNDISALSGLDNLSELRLNDNNILSLEPLGSLNSLSSLFLINNLADYNDISPVVGGLKDCDFLDEFFAREIDSRVFIDLKTIKAHEDAAVRYALNRFPDLKENDWFTKNVSYLVALGVIDGCPNGTFQPNGIVTADAFIKMTVSALGHKMENGRKYWADPYILRAKDLKLVNDGEFADYTQQISRQEMARIIVRALKEDYDEDLLARLGTALTDYDRFDSSFTEYMIKAYAKGIATGYPDGSFRPEALATRATAAAMIMRMLDMGQRIPPAHTAAQSG